MRSPCGRHGHCAGAASRGIEPSRSTPRTRLRATTALAIEIARRERSGSELLKHLYVNRGRALELRGAYDDAIQTRTRRSRVSRRSVVTLAYGRTRSRARPRSTGPRRRASTPNARTRCSSTASAIARALGDRMLIAQLQRDQVHIHLFRGHVKQAIEVGEESLAAATEIGSQEQLMYTSNDIVCAYREAGLLERAREAAIRATALARKRSATSRSPPTASQPAPPSRKWMATTTPPCGCWARRWASPRASGISGVGPWPWVGWAG